MASHAAPQESTGLEVVSISDKNPKVRTVRVARPEPEDTSFLPATLKGLAITIKHFFTNITTQRDIETVEYPEKTIPYPERSRGLHRLMKREDDTVRCVACMCCPTVCPANCITIIPAEYERETETGRTVEKYPAVFEIDELRCVVCGLCVESCPCDAIRMDTGEHAKPTYERRDGVLDKDALLSRGIASIAVQGGDKKWRDK